MNKQTFPIPEGCKAISMEIIDNQIVTTFEPAHTQPVFKRGDVLYAENEHYNYLVIFKKINESDLDKLHYYVMLSGKRMLIFNNDCNSGDFRHATPEETQRLWDALAKEGKRWNPEKMEVEKIKKEIPMAKLFEVYYFVESNSRRVIESSETKDSIDSERHRYGNYFLSKEQAQRAADKLKSALDEFWNEELK